jgi:hypothetical protein
LVSEKRGNLTVYFQRCRFLDAICKDRHFIDFNGI